MSTRLTALTLALLTSPAFAQTSEVEKRMADLERKVAILSQELEAQKTGTSVEAKEQGSYGLGAAASKVYEAKGGLSIGGYGEFLYSNIESRNLPDGTRSPNERTVDALRLILYTGYKFTDTIVFNSEVEFEHGGYSDEHVEGEAVVEFAYLDFLMNKAFNVRAGMVLLPLGFQNEQHEPPAFLGARRSFTERYVIPSTWHENGVGIHGEFPANLSYRLFLVNGLDALGRREGLTEGFSGEGIKGGRQAGKEALATSLAWTGRLDWNPVPGTTVGAGFYTGNSNQSGEGEALRTNLYEVHAEYRAHGWQARGLFARITNGESAVDNLPLGSAPREVGTEQFGGYLELGYDLWAGRGKQSLVPFARWERLNTQQKVVSGVEVTGEFDRTVLTFGVNYKPIPQVAVKVDYTRLENHQNSGQNSFNLALGYYF